MLTNPVNDEILERFMTRRSLDELSLKKSSFAVKF